MFDKRKATPLWSGERETLIEKPEAYLFRIAANLAYEHRLQHSRRGEEISDYDEALVDTSDSPEARAEN